MPTTSPSRPSRPTRRLVAASLVLAGGLTACGSEDDDREPTSAATGSYPVTIENCGAEVTFDKAPERVVLLKSSSVPFLHELGVLDRVRRTNRQVTRREEIRPEFADRLRAYFRDDVALLGDLIGRDLSGWTTG